MSPDHEQHEIILGKHRRAYLWLPKDLTQAECGRFLAWFAFTRPTLVVDPDLGKTSDTPEIQP